MTGIGVRVIETASIDSGFRRNDGYGVRVIETAAIDSGFRRNDGYGVGVIETASIDSGFRRNDGGIENDGYGGSGKGSGMTGGIGVMARTAG